MRAFSSWEPYRTVRALRREEFSDCQRLQTVRALDLRALSSCGPSQAARAFSRQEEFPDCQRELSSSQSFQAGEAHSPSAVLRREGSQSFRAPRSARNRRPFRVVVCKGSHEGETLIADRHSGCPSFQTARALSLWTLAKSGQQPSERESPRSFRIPSLPKPPQSARARRLSNSQFVEALVRQALSSRKHAS